MPLAPRSDDTGERLIDRLASAPDLKCTYDEDGAAESSVLQNPVPEVIALLKLGRRLIPLLIDHLDDVRQTAARYDGGRFRSDPLRVSVGFVCLDILTNVVRTKRGIVRSDCADHGLMACVKQGYYFRPTVFTPSKDTWQQRKPVRVAKANWNAALRNGWIRFEYPHRAQE
ncbi:MAG TPA: hypothetical protein VKF81_01900 [Blastocatellia bacterium]|nr:hypothetical protein [Blastocatellia bacterium]